MTELKLPQGRQRARRALTTLFLILLTATAGSQQQTVPNAVQLETEAEVVRRYSVEMIVFEYVGSAAGSSEIFQPEDVPEPAIEDIFLDEIPAEFTDPLGGVNPQPLENELPAAIDTLAEDEPEFVLLPGEELEEIMTYEQAGLVFLEAEQYQLLDTYKKLVELDAYRPLMHTAWMQPTLEKEATIALKLRRLGDPPLRLNGTVSLYLSRFLHLVIDFSLEEKGPQRLTAGDQRVRAFGDRRSRPAFSFDPEFITPSTFYRIEEDRIVRNGELRYFDHPKFGVIARITRIEEDLPEQPDTTNDLLPGNANQT
jgi:hypothetical protein